MNKNQLQTASEYRIERIKVHSYEKEFVDCWSKWWQWEEGFMGNVAGIEVQTRDDYLPTMENSIPKPKVHC